MAKVAICGDIHLGIRKNSEIMLESQLRFFNNQMFPYLREHDIKNIVVLGDVFDTRPAINTKIYNEAYDLFNNDFQYTVLVGNHDCYGNSNLKIHSLKILRKFSNVTVIESMRDIPLFDRRVLFVPWIFDNEKFLEDMNKSTAEVCFGHFDVATFSMGGKLSESSLTIQDFSKFKKVFSGHFHTPQVKTFGKTEFVYCGSIAQYDWGEVGQKKGFYIFDTETLEYEFIENTVSAKHIKIFYGDEIDPSVLSNNFVKVFIKESETSDDKKFDEFTKKITDSGSASIATCIVKEETELDNTIEISEKGQTLLELINEYVALQEKIENKEIIISLLSTIYTESLRE